LREGIQEENIRFIPAMYLRYLGQYHEVTVELTLDTIRNFDLDSISKAFHEEHNRQFGYSLEAEGTEIEVINLRLRAIGISEKPNSLSKNRSGPGGKAITDATYALKGRRRAYIPESDRFDEIPVYDGDNLNGVHVIEGPAIIEQVNTSILLGESYNCQTGFFGSYIVYNKEKFPEGVLGKSMQEELVKLQGYVHE